MDLKCVYIGNFKVGYTYDYVDFYYHILIATKFGEHYSSTIDISKSYFGYFNMDRYEFDDIESVNYCFCKICDKIIQHYKNIGVEATINNTI